MWEISFFGYMVGGEGAGDVPPRGLGNRLTRPPAPASPLRHFGGSPSSGLARASGGWGDRALWERFRFAGVGRIASASKLVCVHGRVFPSPFLN